MRLTGTCVLVLSVLAFAGSAYAGNGNGNGKGSEGGAPGNSSDAPGQVKKDAPAAAPTTTAVTTVAAAPTATGAAAPAAANETGVKPSNETAHDTHAEAQSGRTKQYGNGQTAGEIAEKHDAAANAVLHGPGNSQPHKLAACTGGHEVDVHALSGHRARGCGDPAPTPHPQPVPTPDPGPTVHTTTTTATTTTGTSTTTAGQQASSSEPGSKGAYGESNGEIASFSSGPGDTQGVLSATRRIGHAATLPFTGARLWLVALVGVMLIVTGLALREIRTADARVQSGHDHSDRSRRAARSARASIGGRPGR